MEITITPRSLGLAQSIQERLAQQMDSAASAPVAGDTVSISEQAKTQFKMAKAGSATAPEQQSAGGSAGSGAVDASSAKESKAPGDAEDEKIAQLKKQIEAMQKQLDQANEKLQQALAEQEAAQAQQAGSEDAPPPEDSAEVKSLKAQVGQLAGQIQQANQELQKAIDKKNGAGGGGGGCIVGTRAGSTGVGKIEAHIGSPTDPYAAAAAEAAEMAGTPAPAMETS